MRYRCGAAVALYSWLATSAEGPKRPTRGPTAMEPTSAAMPPTRCTTAAGEVGRGAGAGQGARVQVG